MEDFVPHPNCEWGYDPKTYVVVTTKEGMKIAINENWGLSKSACPRCGKQIVYSSVHIHCSGTHDGSCTYMLMSG